MENYFWPYFVGYAYTILLGGFFTIIIMEELNRSDVVGYPHFNDHEKKTTRWYGIMVGLIESFMYLSSLLIGKAEFIAVWLAFKVIGRWESAKLEADQLNNNKELTKKDRIKNCANYNIFLMGNALNIVFAATGWKIVIWLKRKQSLEAIIIILVVVAVSLVFHLCAQKQTKRLEKLSND